jgi:predicted PurR-regulated permease PerM
VKEARPPLTTWWVTRVLVVAATVVAVIVALQLVFAALSELAHVIMLVVFGVIMAFVLAPLVDRIAPRIGRAAAVAITAIGARLGDWSQQAGRGALRVGAGILDVLIVFVLGIYFLASAPRVRRWVDSMIPTRQRTEFRRIELDAARLFGRYIRGQLLLGVIIGTVSAIAYLILGVPYAVFLGVLAGVLELVPIAGPIVAGAVAAVVSLTEPFPLVIWVIIAATAIQQLENHILVPRIAGTAVGLHPLAALLAVLVGVEVAGVVGALFAVPLTGLAWSIYRARVDPEAAKRAEAG